MNDSSKPISGAWLVVALLWAVGGLNYLDRIMITTMHKSLVEAIPMTDAQFGLLTSIFLWVYGILSPLAGFLADRFSRSRIIVGSVIVWSAVTWLTGQAKTFEQLLTARALMGVSEACYLPAALALITDYHRGATRSLATGINLTGLSVGSGLGGLGGWLAERYDWSFAFHLCGLVGILYSILLAFILHDAPHERNDLDNADTWARVNFKDALLSLFSSRSFLFLLAFWGLLAFSSWGVVGWMPTYLYEHFHLSQGLAGFSATGYYYCAIPVGLLVGGAWADRWSRSNPRGRIFVCLIGFCFATPGLLLAAGTNNLTVALAGLVLFGLARSFTDANMMPILCMVSDRRYRATGFGVLNLSASIIAGASIYLMGALRDAQVTLRSIFLCATCSLLVCTLLLFLVRPAQAVIHEDTI